MSLRGSVQVTRELSYMNIAWEELTELNLENRYI